MAIITNPAIVLRHVDFRESDRVITLFTRDYGRISGLARGVRRSVRRFSGRLDLFSLAELQYREGRGDLVNLEGALLISAHLGIREDLFRIAWASYLSELVERLFGPGEPHPSAFELLVESLEYLGHRGALQEGVLRVLELRFLAEAGLQPELEACVNCRRPVGRELLFSFVVTRGGPVCERCAPVEAGQTIPGGTLELLSASLRMPLEALRTLEFTPEEAQGAKELLAAFLRYHVAPLKSAAFLAGLEPEPPPVRQF